MSPPDVVYVVRPGERNEELRWSLRSLSNLPHGRVWIAGYRPKWVTGVEHIPTSSRPGGHQNAKANLRAACEHPEVSESFVYMNDDFFVMEPLKELPVMHRGSLAEAIRSATMANAYTRAMRQTLEILAKRGFAEPLMYDLHAPMTVTKAGMLEALALCRSANDQERTLFGNINAVGGERGRNYKTRRGEKGWESWPFLSTNDSTFTTLPVGEHIRTTFPDQSVYEATPPPVAAPRAIRTPRTPVRRHATPRIRRVRSAA